MKKTRFTEEQIAFALRQAETGTYVGEICRKIGVSEATSYKKYGGLGVSELSHHRSVSAVHRIQHPEVSSVLSHK